MSFKFGDRIENTAASIDNPQKYGYFVRSGLRVGRLNNGKYIQMTDGLGEFWEIDHIAIVKADELETTLEAKLQVAVRALNKINSIGYDPIYNDSGKYIGDAIVTEALLKIKAK